MEAQRIPEVWNPRSPAYTVLWGFPEIHYRGKTHIRGWGNIIDTLCIKLLYNAMRFVCYAVKIDMNGLMIWYVTECFEI